MIKFGQFEVSSGAVTDFAQFYNGIVIPQIQKFRIHGNGRADVYTAHLLSRRNKFLRSKVQELIKKAMEKGEICCFCGKLEGSIWVAETFF